MNNDWLMKELKELDELRDTKKYNYETLSIIGMYATFENSIRQGMTYEKFKAEMLELALKKEA